MLKLEIKLNDERIAAEHKYKMESLYECLCQTFTEAGFLKKQLADGTLFFLGTGNAKDYGNFGKLITTLKNEEWFMPYVVKWLWYNSKSGRNENDFSVEDVLYHYTKRKSIA